MIVLELINNYREADDYYDSSYEAKLGEIYEENKKEKIRSGFYFFNEYNIELNNREIENNNIEKIYLTIIISLIKKGQLSDLAYVTNRPIGPQRNKYNRKYVPKFTCYF